MDTNGNLRVLLLKDLCGRLPYGIIVHCGWNLFQGSRISEDGELVSINTYSKSIHFKRNGGRITEIPFNRIDGTVLPYLRSMSSMTDEEKKEYELLCDYYMDDKEVKYYFNNIATIDWYHQKHFDCRGLIKLGLALEASEGMYNIKEK